MASEKEIRDALEKSGWQTQHSGWPDFLCWRDHPERGLEVICVEVKDERTNDVLRGHQKTAHTVLARAGIRTYIAKKRKRRAGLCSRHSVSLSKCSAPIRKSRKQANAAMRQSSK